MLYRPVAIVVSLSAGDYLLWNWSLAGNHGLEAIISGLSFPLLLLASAWLIVRTLARLITGSGVKASSHGSRTSVAYSANETAAAMTSIGTDPSSELESVSSSGRLAA